MVPKFEYTRMNESHAAIVEGVTYVGRVAPPLTVTGTLVMGLPLSEWVYITTIVYTLLQTGYFVWKLIKKDKEKNGS